MRNVSRNDTKLLKLLSNVQFTWMWIVRGEGELEIENQGWSLVSSFSQETGAIGQQRCQGLALIRPTLTESSAGRTRFLTQLPHFFSSLFLQDKVYVG
jgi:hypothetical protein